MANLWVTEDGTYGTGQIILIETNALTWSEQDWEDIDSASDSERQGVALYIAGKRGSRWQYA